MGAEIDRLEIEVEAQATKANNALDKLVGKLERLASSLGSINGNSLSGLSTGINDLSKSMQGMKNIGTADFTRLAKNISQIGSVDTSGINKTASAINRISASLGQPEAVINGAAAIGNLANGIAKLGNKSTLNAIDNMPKLAAAMNELMVTLSKAPAVSNNLVDMTTALANLASNGSKVGSSAQSVTNSLNGYSASAQRASKSSRSLASVFGRLYANFFWVKRGADKLWQSIETSMDYVETLNYFDAAFGQVAESAVSQWEDAGAESAEAYYKSFSDRAKELTSKMSGFKINENGTLTATGQPSLGIDPEKMMNYQATFGQMASSMGVASETSLKLSQALTEIGADLASVKNLDFDKVWNDMASGLAGMSRTLDKYGVNIRNVNLQQKLNELGIQANITALNQNDKALLRAIILLENTKYAWGDLAETINQPANQLRLIESNFQNLSRTIGNLFLPAVSQTLPYVNAMVIALQRLATWIGNLLGIDLSKVTSSVADSSFDFSSIADEAENATEAVNKLQKGIRKFDELDVITTPSSSGSGTGGISSGLLDDAFDKAYSEYQKAWDDAFNNMENRAQEIADKIEEFFAPVKNIFSDFFEGDFFAAGQDTSNLVAGILNWFADGIDNVPWNKIGQNIGDYLAGINWLDVFKAAGRVIWEGIKGAVELYAGIFQEAPIETTVISMLVMPKLLKAIIDSKFATGVSKLGGKFKTLNKNFRGYLQNLDATGQTLTFNKGVAAIRDNLTGFQKGLIGVISVAAEFVLVKDAFYDIATGSDNLLISIGKIAAGVGVASGALYLAFGPAGVAVGAITGVIAAISGINKAFDEIRAEEIGNTIKNAMSNPGGTPIEELAQGVANAFENASAGFEDLSGASQSVENVNKNIQSVVDEIGQIQRAMELGVLSVEDGKEQLNNLFGQLVDLTGQKMSALTTYLLGLYGEGGALSHAYDETKYSAEQVTDAIIRTQYATTDAAQAIYEKMQEADFGSDEWNNLYQQLLATSTSMEDFEKAAYTFSDDMQKLEGSIDWDSLFLSNGDIDTTKLDEMFDHITASLDDYLETLDEAETNTKLHWHEMLESAATPEDKELFNQLLEDTPKQFELLRTEAEKQVVAFTDLIQNDFLGKTEQLIDENVNKWNEKGLLDKWWSGVFGAGNEGEYVREALEKQQKNADDLSAAIKESFGDLKEDGVAWASDAASEIYGALFDTQYIFSEMGSGHTSYELRENYKQMINNATDGIAELTAERGKNAKDGFENVFSDTSSLRTAIRGYLNDGMDTWQDEEESHSPSRRTERYGKYAVDGFNLGITENTSSTLNVIADYVGKAMDGFTTLITSFTQIGVNAIDGLINGMSGKASALYDKANEMAENVAKTVQTALDIHSPSRVMFELGGYTMEGFKEGMENLYNPIEASLKALGGRVEVAPLKGISSTYAESDLGSQIRGNQSPIQISTQSSGGESEALLRQQNALLQRQNELLMKLLNKPTISNDDVFSAAKAGYRDEARRLGAQGNPELVWG